MPLNFDESNEKSAEDWRKSKDMWNVNWQHKLFHQLYIIYYLMPIVYLTYQYQQAFAGK